MATAGSTFAALAQHHALHFAPIGVQTHSDANLVRPRADRKRQHAGNAGASIGVVPITAENEDVASVLSAADSACGAAKEGGRNRVHCFE